ncbi:MAG: tRNA glutamyl-Q(34) synthetase GluQRS [Phycisphaerales bacterium]
MHLGNARTFLINWSLAQRHGWLVRMRIEDLDTPRVKPGAEAQCLDILAWLGLTWDGPVTRQSDDLRRYVSAMDTLASRGLVYPSDLTRSQIEAASSAPQEGSHELRCGPEFRPTTMPAGFDDPATNWRLATPRGAVVFEDACAGVQRFDPFEEVGDFVVWTKRGQPSYQLAVVVDDAQQGVTQVVRGDDLASSTARQLLLARGLGLDWSPTFTHLPLVLGEDGRRLAKRHGDTRLVAYRDRGVAPERVIGLLAWWSGVTSRREPMDARAFAERFEMARLPREPVRFGQEDDAWLTRD